MCRNSGAALRVLYKMTVSCVVEIKLSSQNLNSFIREVEGKHGKILTLSELYARNQKLGNEIILGVVDTIFPFNKRDDGLLQIISLFEVTTDCQRGQLFIVCAYNKFATSLTDACLHEGDFAAFCAASIRESLQYPIKEGCHHLEAHIGIPKHPSAKIFFSRKPHITNGESLDVSLEQQQTPNTSRSVLPCASSSSDNQIPHALDDGAVSLQRTQNQYTYKKLSELTEPDKKVNTYGVINAIVKMLGEDREHAVVILRDETCGPDKTFRVHIFFRLETAFPKLEHGYILRLHGLKTELCDGVVDGRVSSAADVVTFPPYGQGIANAFYISGCINFSDSDTERLTELRRWIASQNQQQPLPVVPVTSNTALPPPVLSSEPGRTRLCEIKEAGNYVLHCKVLDVEEWSDEVRLFTVADGTFCVVNYLSDGCEWFVTQEVRILVSDPSPQLKEIKTGALVELTNVQVQVQVAIAPTESICSWPFFSLKVCGNSCSVKIFNGFELEAIQLKRQLQDAGLVRSAATN